MLFNNGLAKGLFLVLFLIFFLLKDGVSASSHTISLSLIPSVESFLVNDIKVFDLTLNFSQSLPSERINHFKVEVSFPKTYLAVPAGRYIDTSLSGFNTVVRIDGPVAANESGRIIIELKAIPPENGPAMLGQINLAKLYFLAKNSSSSPQNIKIDKIKLVSDKREINIEQQNIAGTSFTISGSSLQSGTQAPSNEASLESPDQTSYIFPDLAYVSPTPVPKDLIVTIKNIFNLLFCGLFKICK